VNPGVFALVGPNGAGKTTLIKVLVGLVKPDAGSARVLGFDCVTQSLQVRRLLGYLAEDQRFYEFMRAKEFLEFVGTAKGIGDLEEEVERVLELVGLDEVAGKKIKEYSQGMKQRLGLAQAMLGSPRVMVLDEPTSNLDPLGRHDFLRIVREVGRRATVLLSSHILGEVEKVCDSLAFLNKGRVVYEGDWEELRRDYPGMDLQEIFVEVVRGR
jgi:ABC-2 type transport system ATP-binding protein